MVMTSSIEALQSIDINRLEQIVLETIGSFGEEGCISDDVRSKIPSLAYSSVTARYSSLARKKLITRGPDKRKGVSGRYQSVMRVNES